MRISDWSSDVCSSDLFGAAEQTGFNEIVGQKIMREAGFYSAYFVKTCLVSFAQNDIKRTDIVFKLPQGPRADQRRSHRRISEHPCQRHLSRGRTDLIGHGLHRLGEDRKSVV